MLSALTPLRRSRCNAFVMLDRTSNRFRVENTVKLLVVGIPFYKTVFAGCLFRYSCRAQA